MRILLDVLARFLLLALGLALYHVLLPWLFPDDGGGANIGAGLLGFAGLGVAAGTWGYLDGRRRAQGRLVLLWSVTGLLVGVAWAVGVSVVEPGAASVSATLATMSFLVPFATLLVAVPATIGGTARRALTAVR